MFSCTHVDKKEGAGTQHISKAKSWKLHSADALGSAPPHPTPLHPPSPSLGQSRPRAKSSKPPTAILKTSTPSGFDKPTGWISDHLDPGSIQASTGRRRPESSHVRMRTGVDLHTDPQSEPGASPVGSSTLHTKVSWPLSAPILPPFRQFSWTNSALILPPI